MTLVEFCQSVLDIPSPTYKEKEIADYLEGFITSALQDKGHILRTDDSFIWTPSNLVPGKPHIAFVGHTDVVPDFRKSRIDHGKLYGSGASDMKCGLAAFIYLVTTQYAQLIERYNVSLIVYAKEEGTELEDNGLYELIQRFPDYFKTLDLSIIGEPTNNTIQLGCVGSLHAKVRVEGRASHSARPWDGDNALYKAVPFIMAIEAIQPYSRLVSGLEFKDVIEITESSSEPGRTTIPGWWECNINFRYSPHFSSEEAKSFIINTLEKAGASRANIHVFSNAASGKIIESEAFNQVLSLLDRPIEAKQAWTDVAQLTELGIPSFNYGPGLTAQAHKPDEHIIVDDIETFFTSLKKLL